MEKELAELAALRLALRAEVLPTVLLAKNHASGNWLKLRVEAPFDPHAI